MDSKPVTKREIKYRIRYIRRLLSDAEASLREGDWAEIVSLMDHNVVPEAATIAGLIGDTRLDVDEYEQARA